MKIAVKLSAIAMIVLVPLALLIPFLGRAREVSRQMNCEDNLRKIAIAVHNYHLHNDHFPLAAIRNKDLPPEKRLSWLFAIWPYLEAVKSPLDESRAWDSAAIRPTAVDWIPYFKCATNPAKAAQGEAALTHYVGIAGIGASAPALPTGDSKAGFSGYERMLTNEGVTDGQSTTMLAAETSFMNGPWVAGGFPTVRGLDRRHSYLGSDGQFTSLHPCRSSIFSRAHTSVTNVLFVDGSVHQFSPGTDSRVFEAMATIAGGEELGEIVQE